METSIDKFGRVVIPKKFRDDLGLEPGRDVVIEMQGSRIVLEPKAAEPQWVMSGKVLVFMGELGGDMTRAVEEDRSRRINTLISRSMG